MAAAADPDTRVGIEICSTTITGVVLGADNSLTISRTIPLGPNQPVVEQIAPLVEELRSAAPGFSRIGVAVPGLVDRITHRVAYSANMPGNASVDLVNELKYTTSLDVCIENDANAAA